MQHHAHLHSLSITWVFEYECAASISSQIRIKMLTHLCVLSSSSHNILMSTALASASRLSPKDTIPVGLVLSRHQRSCSGLTWLHLCFSACRENTQSTNITLYWTHYSYTAAGGSDMEQRPKPSQTYFRVQILFSLVYFLHSFHLSVATLPCNYF